MSRKTGAYVAATMKRAKRFTAAELSAELGMGTKTTHRWMQEFHEQKLIEPSGYGVSSHQRGGCQPIAWEWRG